MKNKAGRQTTEVPASPGIDIDKSLKLRGIDARVARSHENHDSTDALILVK
jgi:hypothetical protein